MFEDKISVITPMYNGSKYLESFVKALEAQTLSAELFEIILIDNNSSDSSIELAKQLFQLKDNYRVDSYTKRASSYEARNYGVSLARNSILVFTDVDCIPKHNWLENIYKEFHDREKDLLVAGYVELFYKKQIPNVFETFDQHFFLNQQAYAKEQTGATANLAVSLAQFEQVNGFLEVESGGDRDFCRRVMNASSCKFIYSKQSVVLHPARDTYYELHKKIKRVSKGKARLASNYSSFQKVKLIFKNCISAVLQPKQWKEIVALLRTGNRNFMFVISFSFVSLKLGFLARLYLVKELLQKSAGEN